MRAIFHACLQSIALQEMPEGVPLATPWARALCWDEALFGEDTKARSGEDGEKCHLLRPLVLQFVHRLPYRLPSEVEEGDNRSGFRVEIPQDIHHSSLVASKAAFKHAFEFLLCVGKAGGADLPYRQGRREHKSLVMVRKKLDHMMKEIWSPSLFLRIWQREGKHCYGSVVFFP